MGFLLYLIGSVVVVAGIAWIATLAGVSQSFVVGGALILLAIALFTAAARRGHSDPA
jgi:F0F1-type ATP synthase assembly protein I